MFRSPLAWKVAAFRLRIEKFVLRQVWCSHGTPDAVDVPMVRAFVAC